MKYVRCTVRDSRELGQKYLHRSSTHMHENTGTLKPSCITVLSVLIMKMFKCYASINTFSRNKSRKKCEESRWRSQSAFVWPAAMSCLDAKISLVPLASTDTIFNLIDPCNAHPNTQSHRATKIHTIRPLTYELFF